MNSITQVPTDISGGQSFRMALRSATRADHDASEALFLRFMEDPSTNMAPFLAAQHGALSALARASANAPAREIAVILPQLIHRLSVDCDARSVTPPTVLPGQRLSGLACAYLVLGSQMGVDAMRVRVRRARIEPMPRFFEKLDRRAAWTSVTERLAALDPDGPAAKAIIDDVRTGYALYARAATLAFDGTCA